MGGERIESEKQPVVSSVSSFRPSLLWEGHRYRIDEDVAVTEIVAEPRLHCGWEKDSEWRKENIGTMMTMK